MVAGLDRRRIRELLGGEIDRTQLSRPEVRSARDLNGWQLHDLLFRSNTGDAIPAYWACPAKADVPVPALLYCHAHGDRYSIGREELLDSRPALQGPYAADLVERG
ncbi:MAG: alpha/beta hydrolase, partial [bacterium]|nr:alpha/beta hydrolase [bacterium]